MENSSMHTAYNCHNCLNRKASFCILDLHFMVKTKEKMAFFDSGGGNVTCGIK